jgi:hypothetical protein
MHMLSGILRSVESGYNMSKSRRCREVWALILVNVTGFKCKVFSILSVVLEFPLISNHTGCIRSVQDQASPVNHTQNKTRPRNQHECDGDDICSVFLN